MGPSQSDPRGRLRIRRRERALASRCPEGRVGTSGAGPPPSGRGAPARAGRGGRRTAPGRVPDDVVAVAPVQNFCRCSRGLYTTPTPATKYTISFGRRVVEVVAALVAPVAVHPLEPQVAARGAPGRHVGAPSSPRRSARAPGGGRRRRVAAAAGRSEPPRAAGTRRLPRPLRRARQPHAASPAAAGAASAHGREGSPRLAAHAEGRGRRRPSGEGDCRAPVSRLGRLVSSARSAQAVSRASEDPPPASTRPPPPPVPLAAFASRRGLVPQLGGPAPRAPPSPDSAPRAPHPWVQTRGVRAPSPDTRRTPPDP